MHRFYAYQSFTHFDGNSMAVAALYLAAKVEEQPRKMEQVLKVANIAKSQNQEVLTQQDLVYNENALLSTLGFDLTIDHLHSHVGQTCNLVKGE
jgi:cyclin T